MNRRPAKTRQSYHNKTRITVFNIHLIKAVTKGLFIKLCSYYTQSIKSLTSEKKLYIIYYTSERVFTGVLVDPMFMERVYNYKIF